MTDAEATSALAAIGVSVGELLEALIEAPAARPSRLELIQQRARKQYRQYARGAHPDAGGSTDPRAVEQFQRVTTAARAVAALRGVDPPAGPAQEIAAMTISILRGQR